MKVLVPLYQSEITKGTFCLFCNEENILTFVLVKDIDLFKITLMPVNNESLPIIVQLINYPTEKFLFRIRAMDL